MSDQLFNKVDADRYHEVMQCLVGIRLDHGQCEPRGRRACTACNALENLEKLIQDYKGPRVRPARPPHYGWCPVCGGKGVLRERSPDGDTQCENGHKTRSNTWLLEAP